MKMPISAALTLLLVFGGVGAAAQAQSHGASESSTAPVDARFEVVSSPLAAKWTFRLDRVTGHVGQLVTTNSGDATWEEMPVLGLPPVQTNGRPRFQIFNSGLAARWTFLIDTLTGRTWQLEEVGTGKKATASWVLMVE